MRAEMLDREIEVRLGRAWREHKDLDALHRLITSHLRMVFTIAAQYQNYPVSEEELIQEGGLGLMNAARKFDPDRGVRFSTYATFWIRANIQNRVMRDWSLVRIGSTNTQKKLFFSLRRIQRTLEREAHGSDTRPTGYELLERIAELTGISIRDVVAMDVRLAGTDLSLNAPIQHDDEDSGEWIDLLVDEGLRSDQEVEHVQGVLTIREILWEALTGLSERERYVIHERKLRDPSRSLRSIASELNLSAERIRQIEQRVLEKLHKKLTKHKSVIEAFLSG